MDRKVILGLFSILAIGLLIPAYADVSSPLKQYNMGIPIDEIQCNDGKILMQSPSGKPACITVDTADKLADRGYSLVIYMDEEIVFEDNPSFEPEFVIPDTNVKNSIPFSDSIEIKLGVSQNVNETIEQITTNLTSDKQQERDNYLNSLQFGLVGEGEFEGELYGHDQNIHIRQPLPAPYSLFFSQEHYDLSEDGLVGKSNLNDMITVPSSGVTGSSGATIDYREWLPTWVAPGYYLKWIDIIQAEDQISANEGISHIKFTYVPKGVEIPVDINNKEFSDLSMYVINAFISNEPVVHMYSEIQIAEITHNGTDTDVIFEDRWDGYIDYTYAGRSDPGKHGVSYSSPYVSIGSGGSALTMEEHENIVVELFERYESR